MISRTIGIRAKTGDSRLGLWLETATVTVGASRVFAEGSAARWFVTTDDRLLRVATRHRELLRVDVMMPDQVPLETGRDHA